MSAVTLISTLPYYISKEEHGSLLSSTPDSFNDIPAVLVYKEDNVSVTLDPPVDGFTQQDAAQGTLYVISSSLVFMSNTGRGFQIQYPSITLHAIARASTQPAVYCQLHEATAEAQNVNGTAPPIATEDETETEVDIAGDEEGYTDMRELNIIPQNLAALDPIFEALSQCASLHPDPDDDDEDDNDAFIQPGDGEFQIFNGDEQQELSEVGRAALTHLESIIHNPFETEESNSTCHEVDRGEGTTHIQREPSAKQPSETSTQQQ
ncbi:hypothetical protein AMATHDRAFT_138305 [Amanita thiersii Skay4041]|uniref:Methylosome subunit pICln n=1 Tax=Amanita thiersii Skay4041 TaxID=703135 RepID=A0A2A9NXH1_9AGAR|nr:hypothetical protein AMATHDRAFT_138305 [Amanita thiersii Skay4041]